MSIPNLPVDFKDDILNTGVNQKRKYQQTYNSDGSVSFEDVTVYQQQGSNFGAQEVNKTNGAVNNIYAERIVDLDELDLVTEPGFFVDALAVKELNSNISNVLMKKNKGISVTIKANNVVNSSADISEEGYTAVGIIGVAPNVYGVVPESWAVNQDTQVLTYRARNVTSRQVTLTLWYEILYIKGN